jgi:hypothetical protein
MKGVGVALPKKITVDVPGEILLPKETLNTMVEQWLIGNVSTDETTSLSSAPHHRPSGDTILTCYRCRAEILWLCRKFPRWPRSGCAPGIALCR